MKYTEEQLKEWTAPLSDTEDNIYILKEVNKVDGVMEGKKENNKARKESKRK